MSKLSRTREQRQGLGTLMAHVWTRTGALVLVSIIALASCVSSDRSVVTDNTDSEAATDASLKGVANDPTESSEDTDEDAQEAIASGVPDTDIFVFHIDPDSPSIVTAFQANVTRRAGYDNQPKYLPGGNSFVFSSILDGRQSDVYRYDDQQGSLERVTSTPVSEYSPTPRADGTFSTVVVEADGTQRLWSYTSDGEGVSPIRGDVTGIGYHAWLDSQLAVFIVAEPLMHLDVLDAAGSEGYTLAVNIGRSLHALPDGTGFSFVQHLENERSRLNAWDGERIRRLADMPEGVEDMTWLPDGRALTVAAGQLLVWSSQAGTWEVATDLSAWLPGEVTRLAVNDTATRLAIVSQMDQPEPE